MTLLLSRQSLPYDPSAALTGKETEHDISRMESYASSLEKNGNIVGSLQLMEKALQARCRICLSDAATSKHISDACDAAERLITMSNAYGVKCFKANEYDTAEKLFSYAFNMTEENSFPLREADSRRRYLRGVTLNNYGCMERSRGRFSEAFSYLERSMACTGEQSPVAFLNMSAVQTQLRHCEQAAESAMRAMMNLGSSPEDSSLLAVAHHNLAMALEPLDPSRALDEYRSALALAQTTIGRDNETTKIIERNMNRFLLTYKHDDVGGRKQMTAGSSFLGSFRRGTSPHHLHGIKSPEGQSTLKIQEMDDIFPHPFLSTADDVIPQKFTATSRYHYASARKPLEPLAPKRTQSPNKSVQSNRHSEARKNRDFFLTTGTAPVRDAGPAKEYSTHKVSRLQPIKHISRDPKTSTGDSQAAGRWSFSGQPGNRGAGGASEGFAANQAAARSTAIKSSISQVSGKPTALRSHGAPVMKKGMTSAPGLSTSVTSKSKLPKMPSNDKVFTHPPQRVSAASLVTGSTGPSVKKPAVSSLGQDSTTLKKLGYAHSAATNISHTSRKKSFSFSLAQPTKLSGSIPLRSPVATHTPPVQPTKLSGSIPLRSPAATHTPPVQPTKLSGNVSSRIPAAAHTPPVKPTKLSGNISSRAPAAAHTPPVKPTKLSGSIPLRSAAATHTPPVQPTKLSGNIFSRAPAAAASPTQPIKSFRNTSSRVLEVDGDYTTRARVGMDGKQPFGDMAAEGSFVQKDLTRSQRKSARFSSQAGGLELYMSNRLNMLLVDEGELDRKNICASVIQRAFRIYKARKLLAKLLEDRGRNHVLREIREAIATRKLQRWFRKFFFSKWGIRQRNRGRYFISSTQHKAAIRIQKIARGWFGRRRFKRRKFYKNNSDFAALAVQSWWRRIQAKIKLANLKKLHEDAKTAAAQKERRELAAIVIQSSWRARKEERATREERIKVRKYNLKIYEARRRSSAQKIQMWWRLLMARAIFKRLREAKAAREARLLEHQRRMDAATKLQALGRMVIAKRNTENILTRARVNAAHAIREKLLETQAAYKIQRAYKLYYSKLLLKRLQKKHKEKLQEARWVFFATFVQRIGRGFFTRRKLGAVIFEMEIRANEYNQKMQAFESADCARKNISCKNLMTPVVERDETASAIVCRHTDGLLGAGNEEALIYDAQQEVENAPNVLTTILPDTEKILKDEGTKTTRGLSPVLQFVSDVLQEEHSMKQQESEYATKDVKSSSQSAFLVASSEQDVIEDEEKRFNLCKTREFFLEGKESEKKEDMPHCVENQVSIQQYDVKQLDKDSSVLHMTNKDNIVSQMLPTSEAEELHAIQEEHGRLSAPSMFLEMNQKEEKASQAIELPVKEQVLRDTECLEEEVLPEPCVKMYMKTRSEATPSRPEEPENYVEVTQPSSLEMALTVERAFRKRAMAEEKRLREERNALCAKANEYRLKKIAEAKSTEELRFLAPRPPLGRRRRDLTVSTSTYFVASPSEKLLQQEKRDAAYLAKKEQATLIISRVVRGHLDRRYARAIRAITMEYVDYRVDMDKEEPPILDQELLHQVTKIYNIGVEKARSARHTTIVQAFLRAVRSVYIVTERRGIARLPGAMSSVFFQSRRKSDSIATLCGFVRIIRAKKELAARKQAVLDYLEATRRLYSVTRLSDFVKLLQAKKERLARSSAINLYLISEEKKANFSEVVDVNADLLHSAATENDEFISSKTAEEKKYLEKWAAKKIACFLQMCLAKRKLEDWRRFVQDQRLYEIELEEVLDRAAMRVQRAFRSYKARRIAKEQRDAKKRHWYTLRAQDEELTAAINAIVADVADGVGLWGTPINYSVGEEEAAERDVQEMIQCVLVVQQMARGRLAQLHLQELLRQRVHRELDA